jgi:hypothetical protein
MYEFKIDIGCLLSQSCPVSSISTLIPLQFIVYHIITTSFSPISRVKGIPSNPDRLWINIIGKIVDFWNIHELRNLVSIDIENIGVQTDAYPVFGAQSVFLETSTWEHCWTCVIEGEVDDPRGRLSG